MSRISLNQPVVRSDIIRNTKFLIISFKSSRQVSFLPFFCLKFFLFILYHEPKFLCLQVSRLRLLGDHVHSTRIAFVEFVMVWEYFFSVFALINNLLLFTFLFFDAFFSFRLPFFSFLYIIAY